MTDFDDQFDHLWALAYRVAYRMLGDRLDAEDVAQDAMVRVALRWTRIAPYSEAFTAKVAADAATDAWRRRGRRRRALPAAAHPAEESDVLDTDRAELVAALRRLPARQRQAVVLRYVADLSERDTASALRCSEGTVKQHASRGLKALRLSLTPTRPEHEHVQPPG